MAVTRNDNAIRMTEVGDTVDGKLWIKGVLTTCGTGNWHVQIADAEGFIWFAARGSTHDTVYTPFDRPLPVIGMEVISKGVCPVIVYIA